MKKPFIVITLLVSLALVACSAPAAAQEIHSDKQRNLSPQITSGELAALVDGNTAFALALYQSLKDKEGNLFYSPYSLSLALAMAYAGARGDTEKEMAATLHFTLSQEKLHQAFNYLALELAKREKAKDAEDKEVDAFRLDVANDIWGQKDYQFLAAFLDTLAVNYGAGLRILDFIKDAESARQTINKYISEKTEGKIKDLIPEGAVNDLTRLVLTNAIYFNAAWAYPFEEEDTRSGTFKLLDGTTVSVPMMNQTEFFGYATGSNYQAVELPYVGRELSMLIIMPNEGQFSAFEKAFDPAQLSSITGALKSTNIALAMPKFEFDSSFGLKQTLASMGMPIAFTDNADFSGMTGRRDLLIQDVVHKAYVSVDEAGTEAAAARAVIMGVTWAPPEPIKLTLDHPFIFLIRDMQTGTVLFIGRVLNPTG